MKKSSALCVGGVPKPTSAMVFRKKRNSLFGSDRNLRCLKNRALQEVDSRPMPTAKIELFVTMVFGWKPYITVLLQGVLPLMLVEVLDLFLITMVFCKILTKLRIFEWKIQKLEQRSNQSQPQPRKVMFLPQMILKTALAKLQTLYKV